MRKLVVISGCFILILCLSFNVFADHSPQSTGKGGTGVIDMGLPALYLNPASVHPDNGSLFSMELGFQTGQGNNQFNLNDLANFPDLEKKENALDLFRDLEEDGLFGYQDLNTGLRFRATPSPDVNGSFTGFGGLNGVSGGNIGGDLFQFHADLIEIDEDEENERDELSLMSDIKYEDSGVEAAYYLDRGIGFSYALTEDMMEKMSGKLKASLQSLQVNRLALGTNLHHLKGGVIAASHDAKIDFTEIEVQGESRHIPAGEINFRGVDSQINEEEWKASGWAMDMGFYSEFKNTYALGFSVQNLISNLSSADGNKLDGKIEFNKDKIREDILNYMDKEDEKFEDARGMVLDDIIDEFEEAEEDWLQEKTDIDYSLPAIIRLGGSIEATERITVSAGTTYKYHRYIPDNIELGMGLESNIYGPLILRNGLNYSRFRDGLELNTGFGVDTDHFSFDIAFSDMRAVFGSGKSIEIGTAMGVNF
ncbi:MAG: hypothetical protein ACOCQB_02000 [Halanaerobiaceae bacterium]